jgi:hypothetical protein
MTDYSFPECFRETIPAGRFGSGRHADRATILDANKIVAEQLGDGKETDGKTNRPDRQTNPALFAAPHSLTIDSKGNACAAE